MKLTREAIQRMISQKQGTSTVISSNVPSPSPTTALGPLLTSLNSEAMPVSNGYLHWTGSAWEWTTPTVDLTPYAEKTWVQQNFATPSDISGKADKVTSATSGHLAGLNSSGNLTDSGVAASSLALIGATQGSATIANFDPQTDTVHVTAQILGSSAQAQARSNISAVGSSDVTKIVKMTQAAYDLITPDSETLYIITSS